MTTLKRLPIVRLGADRSIVKAKLDAEIVRLYRYNKSRKDIAAMLGLTPAAVARAVNEAKRDDPTLDEMAKSPEKIDLVENSLQGAT